MPVWNDSVRTVSSGLIAAALLALPAVGCGGDGTTPTPGIETPTPTAGGTPTATATPSGSSGQFPDGNYYFQSAYVFSFRDYPYYITFAGFADGGSALTPAGGAGDYVGEYIIIGWNTKAAYQGGADPDCFIYESMEGTTDDGADPDVDYDSCEYCDPFSDYYSIYAEDSGCEEDLFDLWYYDDEAGDYDYEFYQMTGYRHAASDGWPSDFSESYQSWADAGYQGVLYDLLVGDTGLDFAANYYVRPDEPDEGARMSRDIPLDLSNVVEIQLDSINDLRDMMGR